MGSNGEDMDLSIPSNKRKARSPSGSSCDSVIEKDSKMPKTAHDECLIEVSSEEVKLSKLSPVKIKKWLDDVVGKCEIKPTPSGKLVVSCHTSAGGKLMTQKKFEGFKITVQRHIPTSTTQSLKGIAHGVDLDFSEDDLKDDLSCESGVKITDVKRLGNTKSIVITFGGTQLPSHVFFGYLRYSVKLFIPNPIRCFKCQRYGHIAKNCRSVVRCGKCGQNHDIKECSAEKQEKCCNCQGDHKASSRDCAFYKEAQSIVKVKTEQRITYSEAVKQVRSNSGTNNVNSLSNGSNVQDGAKMAPKDSNSAKVGSSSKPVSVKPVPGSNPFDWNKFAAFMVKVIGIFSGKSLHGKETIDIISLVSELVTECFHINIDQSRAIDHFKEIPELNVSKPNTA